MSPLVICGLPRPAFRSIDTDCHEHWPSADVHLQARFSFFSLVNVTAGSQLAALTTRDVTPAELHGIFISRKASISCGEICGRQDRHEVKIGTKFSERPTASIFRAEV